MPLPLKWPAYGLSLFKQRAEGYVPWLVIAAIGVPVDWDTLRGAAGVARIGFGPRFPYLRGDYRPITGLNVLVSSFGWQGVDDAALRERDELAMRTLWERGEPGTLWLLAGGAARRLRESPDKLGLKLGYSFFEPAGEPVLLGELREAVNAERRKAIEWSEG
ncbi:MAG TPA: hypothetical protein VN667_12995, partial [Burkholderiales bacterium]|nr:hypothetical protein [Burkholderiales bacterium]